MVLDTSALIAMLFNEPERPAFARAVEADPIRLVSAVSRLEASIVAVGQRGEAAGSELRILLDRIGARIVPFDAEQADLGEQAFARFGKGQHPAGLNFGDCAAYALSRVSGEPLLFKGGDFARTDVTPALPVSSAGR